MIQFDHCFSGGWFNHHLVINSLTRWFAWLKWIQTWPRNGITRSSHFPAEKGWETYGSSSLEELFGSNVLTLMPGWLETSELSHPVFSSLILNSQDRELQQKSPKMMSTELRGFHPWLVIYIYLYYIHTVYEHRFISPNKPAPLTFCLGEDDTDLLLLLKMIHPTGRSWRSSGCTERQWQRWGCFFRFLL